MAGEKGYDDKMGARPLGRVIQEHIKKPLAEELLFGKLTKGGTGPRRARSLHFCQGRDKGTKSNVEQSQKLTTSERPRTTH
jgi:ATP-dependent Clp protease ATP-binding subunit ClpA